MKRHDQTARGGYTYVLSAIGRALEESVTTDSDDLVEWDGDPVIEPDGKVNVALKLDNGAGDDLDWEVVPVFHDDDHTECEPVADGTLSDGDADLVFDDVVGSAFAIRLETPGTMSDVMAEVELK